VAWWECHIRTVLHHIRQCGSAAPQPHHCMYSRRIFLLLKKPTDFVLTNITSLAVLTNDVTEASFTQLAKTFNAYDPGGGGGGYNSGLACMHKHETLLLELWGQIRPLPRI
jgi:hypothetical protein